MLARRTFLGGLAAASVVAADKVLSANSEGCKLGMHATWPTRPRSYHAVVDGEINGQKVGIVLDTGSTASLVVRSAVERLNLTLWPSGGYRLLGIGGESYAESVVIDELRIARSTRKNWRALVAEDRDVTDDVAVLIGQDFLKHFDVEFDLPQNVVRLFEPKGHCDGVGLAYWSPETALEVPIDVSSAVTLDVEVNGQRLRAIVDSGALTTITTAAAAKLGIAPGMAGGAPGGCAFGLGRKEIERWIAPIERVSIGSETIERPKLYVADLWKYATYAETGTRLRQQPAELPDMLLGVDFLRSHRVLISHSQRKMYFSYVGGTVFPSRPGRGCMRN
jgi:predicted aspartyl protease